MWYGLAQKGQIVSSRECGRDSTGRIMVHGERSARPEEGCQQAAGAGRPRDLLKEQDGIWHR